MGSGFRGDTHRLTKGPRSAGMSRRLLSGGDSESDRKSCCCALLSATSTDDRKKCPLGVDIAEDDATRSPRRLWKRGKRRGW